MHNWQDMFYRPTQASFTHAMGRITIRFFFTLFLIMCNYLNKTELIYCRLLSSIVFETSGFFAVVNAKAFYAHRRQNKHRYFVDVLQPDNSRHFLFTFTINKITIGFSIYKLRPENSRQVWLANPQTKQKNCTTCSIG